MSEPKRLGGIIHTYQKYDPQNFPSPTQPPPDLVSPAFEHMLAYGSMRELTRRGAGPGGPARSQPDRRPGPEPGSADGNAPRAEAEDPGDLRDRSACKHEAAERYPRAGPGDASRPPSWTSAFAQAFEEEQLYDLERLWYRAGDERERVRPATGAA